MHSESVLGYLQVSIFKSSVFFFSPPFELGVTVAFLRQWVDKTIACHGEKSTNGTVNLWSSNKNKEKGKKKKRTIRTAAQIYAVMSEYEGGSITENWMVKLFIIYKFIIRKQKLAYGSRWNCTSSIASTSSYQSVNPSIGWERIQNSNSTNTCCLVWEGCDSWRLFNNSSSRAWVDKS